MHLVELAMLCTFGMLVLLAQQIKANGNPVYEPSSHRQIRPFVELCHSSSLPA